MPRRAWLLAALLALALAPAAPQAADPDPVALAAIKKMGLGSNLATLSYRLAQETPTYQKLVEALGVQKARLLVRDEVTRLAAKYQEQWDRNLALAYTEFMLPRELQSLAETGPSSPAFAKFTQKQAEVNRSMEAKSAGLMKDLAWEALTSATAQAGTQKK